MLIPVLLKRMNGMVYVVLVLFLVSTVRLQIFVFLVKVDTIITANRILVSKYVLQASFLLSNFASLATLSAYSAQMLQPIV